MYEVFGTLTTRTFRVLWALEELGQEYTLTNVKPHDPALLAVYPVGKIPAMRDGDAILTDSTAIMTYLGDKHAALVSPAGTIARAHEDAMVHAVLDEVDALLWTGARHGFILPEQHRVREVKPSLKWEFNRNINRLADRIKTPFAAGDSFTIADIILTHCLNWAISAKFDYESEQMKAYAARMRERPAFQRVRALA